MKTHTKKEIQKPIISVDNFPYVGRRFILHNLINKKLKLVLELDEAKLLHKELTNFLNNYNYSGTQIKSKTHA